MEILLSSLAKALGTALKQRKWQITVAESCTGGGLAYWLTSVPGCSEWFDRGVVTYSNEAKIELINVPAQTIKQYGAVSEETAQAMAEGVLKHSNAQISIAITGIAGPSGGSIEKPAGTVWFAWAGPFATYTRKEVFSGDRSSIRKQAIAVAMEQAQKLVKN